MTTLILTLAVLAACFLGMAVGLIFKKKPLQGSCGGSSAKGSRPDMECVACGGDAAKCETKRAEDATAASRSS